MKVLWIKIKIVLKVFFKPDDKRSIYQNVAKKNIRDQVTIKI